VQAQLIEDLLDMSRIISGKVRIDAQPMAPISAVEAAIETVRHGADAKGVRVDKLLDPAAGPITGDPARLQQVVWNLLSNAIKFTPKGGRVLVTLEKADSSVQISVADTGAGIDRAFLPHVFERFKQADASTTRHHGGLGLGLSIVKHLVELHGGTVDVESEGEDRGTKFTIRLPLSPFRLLVPDDLRDTRVRSLNAPAQYQRVNLAGIRVLVVDDVDDARELIKRVLVECDAEVTTAASAEEGLSVLATCESDVLVSDIGMPDVDGYEFLRRLRALGGAAGKIPAVALTAFARSEDRVRALRAGYQVHVSKPVEPSELIATIASVMGRSAEPITLQKVT
jgi:CheY-like chemotaxis protein